MSLNKGAVTHLIIRSLLLVAVTSATARAQGLYIRSEIPNSTPVGKPFLLSLWLEPAAKKPMHLELDPSWLKFDKTDIVLQPGEHKHIIATALASTDGVAWLRAWDPTGIYEDTNNAINVGFLGHLKLIGTEKIPYGRPSTLALALLDNDGKPFASSAEMKVVLQSSDANLAENSSLLLSRCATESRDASTPTVPRQSNQNCQPLSKTANEVALKVLAGATVTPQFQIMPDNIQGGAVHLNVMLTIPYYDLSLYSEYVTISAKPAPWLPVVLAIGGGLLFGLYKLLNTLETRSNSSSFFLIAVILTSAIGGYLGYLIADLDLLGLKLDPDVLRSYPLIGFLVAYIGIESLIKKKMPSITTDEGTEDEVDKAKQTSALHKPNDAVKTDGLLASDSPAE